MEAETLQKLMEMTMGKCKNESEDEQTTSNRKTKTVDRFAFLPDDILLEILKRVPDVFLRYKAKYVCRRWSIIITNRILLDHASFILQNSGNFKTRLVDIMEKEEEGLQVKEQDLDIPPYNGTIRSWCNEFLLISDDKRNSLYIYNQITKEGSYLPEYNRYCEGHNTCGAGLSFDSFKGIYKVSHLFIRHRTIECRVFNLSRKSLHHTLKWKTLQVPYEREGQYIWGDAATVQGRYSNWIIRPKDHLVCVDMVKEEILLISLPVPGSSNDKEYCDRSLFVMGGFLALMDRVSWDKAEIWLLKDFEKVKWEKVQSISINKYPICGVINKRYIIFKCEDGMYSHDLKSGVQKKLDIHIQYTTIQSDEHCVVHSLAPCFK